MSLKRWRYGAVVLSALFAILIVSGCGDSKRAKEFRSRQSAVKSSSSMYLNYMTFERVGRPATEVPWIAHVNTVDLDQDGLMDIIACHTRENTIIWIRQTAPGVFEESVIAEGMRVPVRVEVADMNGNGHHDLLVASMGEVFPNNDRIGTVFILENDGHQNFHPHAVLENTSRVTDVRAGDFNGDGQLDLAVAQFGYDQGEVSWLERIGPWEFRRHVLLDLSGAINVGVADFNGNGHLDIVTNISQQWEELYYFENRGGGNFVRRRIWGSTNEDYGSSGMEIADMNGNGRPDILFANGDGFGPAATPGPRPWHGLQWIENLGSGTFRYRRIGDLNGAYSPVAVDLDQDGAMDVVAVGGYADWANKDRDVISLMWFRNDGQMNFEPRVLAKVPKDMITLATADFDGTGEPALVTGGFYVYPPYIDMERILIWRRSEQ